MLHMLRKSLSIIACACMATLLSCSSSTTVSLLCDERQVEMYVDDEYAGRGLVQVTVPRNKERIKVSCRENGLEIYSRTYYIKGKDKQLIELSIPKDYRYSSSPNIIKSK